MLDIAIYLIHLFIYIQGQYHKNGVSFTECKGNVLLRFEPLEQALWRTVSNPMCFVMFSTCSRLPVKEDKNWLTQNGHREALVAPPISLTNYGVHTLQRIAVGEIIVCEPVFSAVCDV